jgi:hypothetical protein
MASQLSLDGLCALGVEAKESVLGTYQLMIDMDPQHFAFETKSMPAEVV